MEVKWPQVKSLAYALLPREKQKGEKNQPALHEWPLFSWKTDHIKVRHRFVGEENDSTAEIMNMRTGCNKCYREKYCLCYKGSTVTAQNITIFTYFFLLHSECRLLFCALFEACHLIVYRMCKIMHMFTLEILLILFNQISVVIWNHFC